MKTEQATRDEEDDWVISEKNRKSMGSVVNIGGISHSGSTMLGRIIANDPGAVFLGEVEALFWPVRKHHYENIRRLSVDGMWAKVLRCSAHALYAHMLEACIDKNLLVDCSKSPLWIRARNSDSQELGIRAKNVLVYKTPYELARSYGVRNKNWVRTFENYFRRYFYCVDEFYIVAYRDLLKEKSTLPQLCAYLGIDYFENKEKYWEREVREIFGSNKANKEQSLTYDCDLTASQEAEVRDTLAERPIAAQLWKILEQHRNTVNSAGGEAFRALAVSRWEFSSWAMMKRLRSGYRRLFPEDYRIGA